MLKTIILVLFIGRALISVGIFIQTQNSKSPTSFNSNTNDITTNPNTILPKLSVSGNRIVTEEGNPIRLRGVNFEDPFLLEKGADEKGLVDNHFPKIADDFARVKALGANVVRLTLYPGYYFLVGDEKYLASYVDRMIDLAQENGLYVIISYHVIGRPGGWYESDSDTTMLPSYPAKVHYTDINMAIEIGRASCR